MSLILQRNTTLAYVIPEYIVRYVINKYMKTPDGHDIFHQLDYVLGKE